MTIGAYRIVKADGERTPVIDENRNLRIDVLRVPVTAGRQVDLPVGPSPQAYQGSTKGFLAGGPNASSFPGTSSSMIQSFPFATDAGADTGGDLLAIRSASAGTSSPTHGFSVSGYVGGSVTGQIEKFPFAISSGTSVDIGDQAIATRNSNGNSSDTHGYVSGGFSTAPPPNVIDHIQKFPHSSNANATDVGDLISNKYNLSSSSSRNDGIAFLSGGQPPNISTIQKWPFASDGNSVATGGDLLSANRAGSGSSSETHGYVAGGHPSPNNQVIQKFPFAISSGTSTDVGDLAENNFSVTGISSTTNGYTIGGYFPNSPYGVKSDTIQKYPYASDANAADVGNAVYGSESFPRPGQQV